MSTKKNLWIIEDMEDLQPIYQSILEEEKYDLRFFTTFDEFKNAYSVNKEPADLIVADIFLDDGHFFQLLNESDLTLNTPFLVISGSDEYETMCNAFEADAIDFILKPFNKNEIRAKIEKHLHRIDEIAQETSKSLEALNLDLTQFTNKEIKIIESFNMQEDKTLHRNDIVKVIWKNIAIHPNTLDVHIYNLRKKLKLSNYSIKAIGNGLFKFIEL
ncbi:MAG: hypothetical protein CME64_12180 [Halobacteriovoraceae bacterium]|nr:hypothetical protein [Halobacteriovoraceae bacterium]|tara:strand:+ start:260242 stop:260889 length:648 start_codon:yes stop_codon:yes gene_type:complete